jgi:hypothetical protein
LFPTTIQFSHALTKHNHFVSENQQKLHIEDSKSNCAIFHHQINYNYIHFSLNFSIPENNSIKEKIVHKKNTTYFKKFHFSTSRAPPLFA